MSIVLPIIYTVIQFIVFFFVVIATPLPMFRSKSAPFGVRTCQTLWGQTTKCNGSKYAYKGTAAFGCGRRRNNMNGGAAFAIISIVFTLVALILGILMMVKAVGAIGPLIMTILCVATILICWACVAGVMTETMCPIKTTIFTFPGSKYSANYNYGAGFGLMVTAWCLEVVNLILVILCMCL